MDNPVGDEFAQMIIFIKTRLPKGKAQEITEDTPLISSGLIDSLAAVDIILMLEEVLKVKIPAGKLQAQDLDSVRLMISTARRVGKPL